ncbi:MAG TPA: tetratricopeptide repeat protein [Thermoguttaceae bacterium]|nr:tetratricopeptide repeat protein [Thermoguttaceae bacterium]
MPRHEKAGLDGAQRERGSARRALRAAPARRGRRLGVALLVALVGLGALLLVYRRDRASHPNTIADGAPDARPEVAALLREAGQVADRLVERFPNSPDALDAMAWAHHRFGKTQEAVAYWEKCVELDPGSASAHHSLGLIAQEGGDLAAAAEHFRKAARLDPDSSRHYAAWGESLMSMGELEEAARVLEQDLQARPRSIPSLLLVGQVYVRLKQYEKARETLETAIEMAPGFTSAYYGLGTACTKLGDREKGKEYFEQFKVFKAQDEQRHRDALKTVDDVARVREALAALYTSAGKVYVAHGEVSTAEEHLRKAGEIDPDFAECRQVLAWLYQVQGRTDEALSELRKLEETAAQDPAVCLSVGEIYTELGEFEGAERAYRKLVEISPLQGGGYAGLAKLYLQANRKIAEARALAQKAVELEPVAPYYSMLALVCQRAGDGAGALAAIEEAVTREPGNPEYQRLREMIEKQHAEGASPVAP